MKATTRGSHRIILFGLAALLFPLLATAEDPPRSEATPREQPAEPEKEEPERVEETMVITASRVEERLLDAPAAVSVITGTEVEQAAARDLPDILRRTPGMNVVQIGARDFNLTGRGATSSLATSQQVLVDGRTLYLDFFGFIMWETMPFQTEELEQVEVVRGPGSAVWGANALNGVVNFRTKSPRELAGTHIVAAGAGERDTADLSFLTAEAGDKVSWKFSGGYRQQHEPWPRPTHAPTGFELPPYENSGFENPKFEARVDRDNAGGGVASMTVGAARTSGLIMTGIGPFDIDDGTTLYHGIGSWTRGSTDLRFFTNVIDGDATNVLNELPFLFKSATYDFSGRTGRLVGRHKLTWGGNVRYNAFDLSIAPQESRRREIGAFVTDEWLLSDKWSLHMGGRLDWFDTISTVFSPRAAFVYRADENHSVRLSLNRAYRAPSLINNFLDTTIYLDFPLGGCQEDSVFPVAAVGNPDLAETRLSSLELGYTGRIGRRWSLSVALYYNKTDDLVDFYPASHYSGDDEPPDYCGPDFLLNNPAVRKRFPKSLSYRNVAEIREYGSEASMDFTQGGWRAWLHWSWQNAPEVSGAPESPLDTFAINEPARNRYGGGLTYSATAWGVSASWDWVGRAFWSDVLSDPFWGYSEEIGLLGLKAWWSSPSGKWTLDASATNATDDNDPQHPFGDQLGRIVRTGVKVRF